MENLKLKLYDYLSKHTDRFNCRWLSKRDPELWSAILDATSFLDETALPKQRCWHVLNETYERPVCPVTGEQTAWFENRYLTYISQSAKASSPDVRKKMVDTYEKRTGHVGHWSSNPELIERKRETFYSNIDKHQKQDFTVTRAKDSAWYKSVQETWTNEKRNAVGFKSKEFFDTLSPKERDKWIDSIRSYWTKERRLEQSLRQRKPFTVARSYYVEVNFWTNFHWKTNPELFNPGDLERGYWKNHIDHIYSIRDGFLNNVPAEVIGHWTNLRLIPRRDNQTKNYKSDRTLAEALLLFSANNA